MKLQFTNGYRPRFDQITRILQYLLTQAGKKKIAQREIVAALGIPKNQVKNLISMMAGFGLVQPRVSTLTPLGKATIQNDPYFENINTLWIMHYAVSSNPEWVVWYRIINTVIPAASRYEVDMVSQQYFSDLAIHFSENTITNKLPLEVGAVFAAYTRSDFARLNILSLESTGNFVRSTPVEIPDLAFLYCVLNFKDRFSPGSSAINIRDVSHMDSSPGRVFNLEEYQVRALLTNLHNRGLLRLEQFANLDQIRFSSALSQADLLTQIYGGQDAG